MRRSISNKLEQWKKQSPRKPLLLHGARQVGKTYILKEFGRTSFSQTHYFNFEENLSVARFFERDLNPDRLLEEFQFHQGKSIDPQKDLLVFDEIQLCPRALTSLKYFHEKKPELAICAAGSLLGLHLSNESFPVGSVTFLELWPMNFVEFLDGLLETQLAACLREFSMRKPLPESAHERLWDLWKSYLVVGGLPEAVSTYRDRRGERFLAMQAVRKLQRDLENAYLADIAKHSGKINAMHVERLWKNVPAQLARTQAGGVSKFRFRDAVPGIRGYERLAGPLDWLERAGLVLRSFIVDSVCVPLSACTKESYFKLYFFDVGMLNAVSGVPPEAIMSYGYGSYQGYVAENFVAQELKAAEHTMFFCWHGRTAEVEFLIETGADVVPLEVKSGHVIHSKSLNSYEAKYKPKHSYVLSARNTDFRGYRYHVPLYTAGVINVEHTSRSSPLDGGDDGVTERAMNNE